MAQRRLTATLAVLAAFAGALALHGPVDRARAEFPRESDVLYVPPPDQLRAMSLGYREALADLIWISALVFSGENLGHLDAASIVRYVDAITGLSPRFHRAYQWGGITVVYGGHGSVTREMTERAAAIYARGIAEFPESHELLYAYGMLLTTQVGSTPGYSQAERNAAAAEGVDLIRRAAAFGADPLVRRYAATLVSEYAGEALAMQFLESQLATAADEEHRRLLRRKLSQLAGEDHVAAVEAIQREFVDEHRAQRPYVPDTLYAVIRHDTGDGVVSPP